MMNLLYEPLPETITADGKEFPVVTDFREWIRFSAMLKDAELSEKEKIQFMLLYVDGVEWVSKNLIDALFSFYRADDLKFKKVNLKKYEMENSAIRKPPLFDWGIDAKFLLGDFRRYYQIDLIRVKYLHWWEFRSLFDALPDDSNCQKRVAYRAMNLSQIRDKNERKRIAKIQREIAIPYLTEEEEEFQLGEMFWG